MIFLTQSGEIQLFQDIVDLHSIALPVPAEPTHIIASALRRCGSIARSRRLGEEQGGFAAAANLKANYCNMVN
jgi:hypothetical protein